MIVVSEIKEAKKVFFYKDSEISTRRGKFSAPMNLSILF